MQPIIRTAADSQAQRIVEDWGSLTWLASEKLTGSPDLTVGRVIIKPSKSNPKHTHANCEEVLYLLQGELEHAVGAETILLKAGDTLSVPAGIAHNAINTGSEDAEMIVVYSSGRREFQKV